MKPTVMPAQPLVKTKNDKNLLQSSVYYGNTQLMKKSLYEIASEPFSGEGEMSVDILQFHVDKKNRFTMMDVQKAEVKATQYKHGLPGGMVKKGKIPVCEAVRELQEECGLSQKKLKLYPLTMYEDGKTLRIIFAAEVKKKYNPIKKAGWNTFSKEHIGFGWNQSLKHWPQPIHPKVKKLRKNAGVLVEKIAQNRDYVPFIRATKKKILEPAL